MKRQTRGRVLLLVRLPAAGRYFHPTSPSTGSIYYWSTTLLFFVPHVQIYCLAVIRKCTKRSCRPDLSYRGWLNLELAPFVGVPISQAAVQVSPLTEALRFHQQPSLYPAPLLSEQHPSWLKATLISWFLTIDNLPERKPGLTRQLHRSLNTYR